MSKLRQISQECLSATKKLLTIQTQIEAAKAKEKYYESLISLQDVKANEYSTQLRSLQEEINSIISEQTRLLHFKIEALQEINNSLMRANTRQSFDSLKTNINIVKGYIAQSHSKLHESPCTVCNHPIKACKYCDKL